MAFSVWVVPSIIVGEQKANIELYSLWWAARGHHLFGSDMQGRSAANAKLRFLRLIVEASDFASAAQV